MVRGLPSVVDVAVGSSVVLSCQAPKENPSGRKVAKCIMVE